MKQKTITILDKMSPCDKERFWAKVDIKSEEECWEWEGSSNSHGYGTINVGGRIGNKHGITLSTHRVAKTLSMGEEIPDGLLVMHTCDNPPCCNPSHLEVGTDQDNMSDKVNKGRQPTILGNSKNDWDIIDDIRSSSLSGKELTEKYGLAKSTVSMIRNNKIWKDEHREKARIPMDRNEYELNATDNCITLSI